LARACVAATGIDAYGGRLDVSLQKTGWFHTQKSSGRWWLVTPDGHAFFSLGVNAVVADGGRTYVEGREFMFKDLPPASGEWASVLRQQRQPPAGSGRQQQGIGYNHGRWFDFYAANLYRVDGKDWLDGMAHTHARSPAELGLQHHRQLERRGAGPGASLAVYAFDQYRRQLRERASGYDYWGRMPDPFDPRFVQATEQAVAKASGDVRDDPYLLGYFADNELAWAGMGPQGRWGLAIGTLRGDANSPAKQAFIAMLKKKYVDADQAGQCMESAAGSSWDMLQASGFVPPNPDEAHPAIADDYSAWLRQYADTYFRVVAEAIHRHDPHHLFLGGRFAVNTPEAVAACAQYCDVVSFNVYADLPQHGFDAAAMQQLDKPVLISEFHFGSDDRGPFGKGVVSVWNEQQRGEAYAKFIAAAANDPDIVGAHWFSTPTSR
jgi:hypothetical protein